MMKSGVIRYLLLWAAMGAFALSLGAVFDTSAYADIIIVANNSVPPEMIKKSELKDIFLGNTIKWEDKTKINIVIQKKSDAHNEFVKSITNKSASQFRNYWKKMVFTGKGSAPKSFAKNAELLAYIAKTDGAIGYIAADVKPEGVKVIKVQ